MDHFYGVKFLGTGKIWTILDGSKKNVLGGFQVP